MRVGRIDIQRLTDDHDAEVKRTGDRRHDLDQAKRRTVERTRQVHLARQGERISTRPSRRLDGPDLRSSPGSSLTQLNSSAPVRLGLLRFRDAGGRNTAGTPASFADTPGGRFTVRPEKS